MIISKYNEDEQPDLPSSFEVGGGIEEEAWAVREFVLLRVNLWEGFKGLETLNTTSSPKSWTDT